MNADVNIAFAVMHALTVKVNRNNMNRQINSFTDRQRNLNWISIKQGNTSYNIPYKHFCYQQCIKKLKTDEVRAKIWRSKLK